MLPKLLVVAHPSAVSYCPLAASNGHVSRVVLMLIVTYQDQTSPPEEAVLRTYPSGGVFCLL